MNNMVGFDWNARGACALYALAEDPDYVLFDADLFSNVPVVVGTIPEYVPVAMIVLSEDAYLRFHGAQERWELRTPAGGFSAQQVICGDLLDDVEMVTWHDHYRAGRR